MRRLVNYDIEADWHLLYTCNFRCSYCFLPPSVLGQRLSVFAEPEEWARVFDGSGMTWLLHVTGGEPSVYPGFAALSEALTRKQ
jgi:molybdenum cofactor biosynthesis enzyme MoaA